MRVQRQQWLRPFYFNPYYPAHYPCDQYMRRPLPEVDSSQFVHSASQMDGLLTDAKKLTAYLSTSKEQAKKILAAAQASNSVLVKKLLRASGITNELETEFNPDGVRLILSYKNPDLNCCRLIVVLRW
ncbi:hypothetical protein QFZ72_001121 [Bacillus sp. V2I10]|nr:hypothetical protein [Bacillus sp. V2I10]